MAKPKPKPIADRWDWTPENVELSGKSVKLPGTDKTEKSETKKGSEKK